MRSWSYSVCVLFSYWVYSLFSSMILYFKLIWKVKILKKTVVSGTAWQLLYTGYIHCMYVVRVCVYFKSRFSTTWWAFTAVHGAVFETVCHVCIAAYRHNNIDHLVTLPPVSGWDFQGSKWTFCPQIVRGLCQTVMCWKKEKQTSIKIWVTGAKFRAL